LGKALKIIFGIFFLTTSNIFAQSTSKFDAQKYKIDIEIFMGMFAAMVNNNFKLLREEIY
jgi:hypothetical protein